MTSADHEARISRFEHWMLTADTPEQRRTYGHAFVQAIKERNVERTPEQVAQLERGKGIALMGYTPLFDTLTKGTLCGRWPDIGLWPVVLSLTDRHGVVDCTPAYIAGVTGLPVDDVVACMKRFCEPDPYSRTQDHSGARLELLDAHRDWGWQVVNHAKYREKARKAMQQNEATASGRDADRKRIERERESGGVQSRPAVSGSDRPSDSDSDSDSDKEKNKSGAAAPVVRGGEGDGREAHEAPSDSVRVNGSKVLPPAEPPAGLNREVWDRWLTYRQQIKKPIKPASHLAAMNALAAFAADQAAVVEQSIANGWQGLFDLRESPKKPKGGSDNGLPTFRA